MPGKPRLPSPQPAVLARGHSPESSGLIVGCGSRRVRRAPYGDPGHQRGPLDG